MEVTEREWETAWSSDDGDDDGDDDDDGEECIVGMYSRNVSPPRWP